MGVEEVNVTGGATLPPCERISVVKAFIVARPLIPSWQPSISKEPLHASSVFDTCF